MNTNNKYRKPSIIQWLLSVVKAIDIPYDTNG